MSERTDQKVRSVIKAVDKITDWFILIICIVMLLLGCYALIDNLHIYYHAQDKSILKYKPTLNESEEAQPVLTGNVAWLTIDDTNIDYPVMQGKDNTEWLNHDPYGNFSLSGSLFLDYQNHADFSDPYSLIYGHHMEYGEMFGALDEFLKKDYFEEHQSGTLIVNGSEHALKIFCAIKDSARNNLIFSPSETNQKELIDYLRKNASIFEEPGEGNVIGMSTCSSSDSDGRVIVFALMK